MKESGKSDSAGEVAVEVQLGEGTTCLREGRPKDRESLREKEVIKV